MNAFQANFQAFSGRKAKILKKEESHTKAVTQLKTRTCYSKLGHVGMLHVLT